MLTPTIKHAIKVIFVIIVITGLVASYLFTGSPQPSQPTNTEPVQEGFQFIGPSSEPAVTGPTTAPAVNGPAAPPPGESY